MSRSKNSRRGSKRRVHQKEFWSTRAASKCTGDTGVFAKKRTAKIERQMNKAKKEDFEQ